MYRIATDVALKMDCQGNIYLSLVPLIVWNSAEEIKEVTIGH